MRNADHLCVTWSRDALESGWCRSFRTLWASSIPSLRISEHGPPIYNEDGRADPPKTEAEVAATQPLDPLDLSGRSRAEYVSRDVPAFDMIDVATGDTVNLRSVVHGRKPILLWKYSPY